MARFLTQRLISSFVSIIGATLVIFLLVQLHNDPRELYVPDSGYGLTEEQWEMLGEKWDSMTFASSILELDIWCIFR